MKTVSPELKAAIQQLADDPELCRAAVEGAPHACYIVGAGLIGAHVAYLLKKLAVNGRLPVREVAKPAEPKPRVPRQVKRAVRPQVNDAPNKCVGRRVCLASKNRYNDRCGCLNCRAWRANGGKA